MERNLKEFRIRGIKTNIPFLENVVKHEKFRYRENMILLLLMMHLNYFVPERKDRGTKMLNYIGNVTVNGFPGVWKKEKTNISQSKCTKSSISLRANAKWNETNFG